MKQSVNRIESEMETWLAKEQRFGKLFSAAVIKSKEFQKEKLAYMEGLQEKYSNQLSSDERLSMRVLNRELQRIERLLYPNILVRLLRKGFRLSGKLMRNRLQAVNEQYLKNQVNTMGLGEMGNRVRQQLSQGKDKFSLPVSHYHNQQQHVEYDLSFGRQHDGTYKMETLKVSLHDEQSGVSRQHSFNMDDKVLTAAQAANLLAGRATLVNEKWVQLDLNDKDSDGKFMVKEFHSGYGYDLLKAVQQLPIKELKNQDSRQRLLDNLTNGERQDVTLKVNGKDRQLSIEANPQFKTINIFDENNQKITLAAALGKEVQQQKKETKTLRLGKRNGLSVG